MTGTEGLTDEERSALILSWHDGSCPDGAKCDMRLAHAQTQGAWAVVGGSVQRAVQRILASRTAALIAERDALREQVARAEALAAKWGRQAASGHRDYQEIRREHSRDLRAALHPTDGAS